MTSERDIIEPAGGKQPDVATLFRAATGWVVVCWAIGFLAVWIATSLFSSEFTFTAGMISLGSGLVAAAAMLSGGLSPRIWSWLRGPSPPDSSGAAEDRSGQTGVFFVAAGSGMILRLLGTVALFLTCRYHLAAPAQWIVTMTIGWYLYLTSVEVMILTRKLNHMSIATTHSAIEPQTLAART